MWQRFKTIIQKIIGFRKIDRLLWKPLVWNPADGESGKYITSKFRADECRLQLNDFPDEPMWTLFYKGDEKEIEDTPLLWKIN